MPEPTAARLPNVILLMADQFRADAMSCAGNAIVRTPNLDRLAAGGVRFERAYTNSPVCMASRGAIHTGRYPSTIRIRSMGILPPEEATLAEALRRAGYHTGMFGKLHFTPMGYTLHQLGCRYELLDVRPFLGPAGVLSAATEAALADPFKRNYGFDEGYPVADSTWGHYIEWLAERSPEHVKDAVAENWGAALGGVQYGSSPPATRLFHPMVSDFFDSHLPAELHPSYFIVQKTIDFIRAQSERQEGGPWFAHCSFVDPHHPFNAPPPFNRMYSPADMPVPPQLERQRCFPPDLPAGVVAAIEKRATYGDDLFQWALADYYGMVSHIDWCVGLLLDELEDLGLADSTLIVFMADHGEYVGDHRLMYKGSVPFEGLWRIPLIFSWPGRLRPGTRRAMVQEIDVLPTTLNLLGLPVHPGVQGIDLTPSLRGEGDAGWDRVTCELDDLPDPQFAAFYAVRDERWKLVYYPNARTGMVFDLTADPGELDNLYSRADMAAVRQSLFQDLLDCQYRSKDPLPIRLSQA